MCQQSPANSPYRPAVGEVVRDLARREPDGRPAEGAYMDLLGGVAYLRRPAGGCEWTTAPERIRPLDVPRFVAVQRPGRPRAGELG